MSGRIDINVDMGESFGRWKLGDDAAMMPFVSSVSIACGFHAGDPGTMRETVAHAIEHDVSIGAHVGLPDLLGFGRRRMAVSPEEVRDYSTFQIGALQAFVGAAGSRLRHVKPHGALYAMASTDQALAGALAEAIAGTVPGLPLMLMPLGPGIAEVIETHGVPLVIEAFPDLDYDPDGSLIIERVKAPHDPTRVADRVVRLVREAVVEAQDGSLLSVDAATACIHGDAPNSVEVARTVRERLGAEGIDVVPVGVSAA